MKGYGEVYMNKDPKKLMEEYSSCPAETKEYVSDGKKITVIRHFTGDKDINKVIADLAESRAKREMGLY